MFATEAQAGALGGAADLRGDSIRDRVDREHIPAIQAAQRTAPFDILAKLAELEPLFSERDDSGLFVANVCFLPASRFEFSKDVPDISAKTFATIFPVRDEFGDWDDLVAWDVRSGRLASWIGRAAMVGEEQVLEMRGSDPLPVFEHMFDWIKAEGEGIFIFDWVRARDRLRGVTLEPVADDVIRFGRILKQRLATPAPPIVLRRKAIGPR